MSSGGNGKSPVAAAAADKDKDRDKDKDKSSSSSREVSPAGTISRQPPPPGPDAAAATSAGDADKQEQQQRQQQQQQKEHSGRPLAASIDDHPRSLAMGSTDMLGPAPVPLYGGYSSDQSLPTLASTMSLSHVNHRNHDADESNDQLSLSLTAAGGAIGVPVGAGGGGGGGSGGAVAMTSVSVRTAPPHTEKLSTILRKSEVLREIEDDSRRRRVMAHRSMDLLSSRARKGRDPTEDPTGPMSPESQNNQRSGSIVSLGRTVHSPETPNLPLNDGGNANPARFSNLVRSGSGNEATLSRFRKNNTGPPGHGPAVDSGPGGGDDPASRRSPAAEAPSAPASGISNSFTSLNISSLRKNRMSTLTSPGGPGSLGGGSAYNSGNSVGGGGGGLPGAGGSGGPSGPTTANHTRSGSNTKCPRQAKWHRKRCLSDWWTSRQMDALTALRTMMPSLRAIWTLFSLARAKIYSMDSSSLSTRICRMPKCSLPPIGTSCPSTTFWTRLLGGTMQTQTTPKRQARRHTCARTASRSRHAPFVCC
ncbi:hypothetical protein BC831DRAFT_43533 [Entophlyctis helioformis]|nr:hypothetical protein BC831DRAFT_43533 [Entophlyctis helioformis]